MGIRLMIWEICRIPLLTISNKLSVISLDNIIYKCSDDVVKFMAHKTLMIYDQTHTLENGHLQREVGNKSETHVFTTCLNDVC